MADPLHSRRALLGFSGAAALTIVALLLRGQIPWILTFPAQWTVGFSDLINVAIAVLVDLASPLFRAMSTLLEWPMRAIRDGLQAVPWQVLTAGFVAVALRAGGAKLALFCAVACVYIQTSGYWVESLNSLALVSVAFPLSVLAGLVMGVVMNKSRRLSSVLTPTLDFMQTAPAFAYLVPLIVLFGFGPVVGLIASAIYAIPPMARNTKLGLDLVPADLHEVAAMTGCSPTKRFWLVEVPTALPQLLVGLNQTIMAVLSMVVFAAIIGGFEDIGWEVLRTMRRAQFGESLMAGVIITLIAILLDRVTRGFALQARSHTAPATPLGRYTLVTGALMAVIWGLSLTGLAAAEGVRFDPAGQINTFVADLSIAIGGFTDGLKNGAIYYFLLPVRIGLEKAISPYTWGIAFTPALQAVYWGLLALIAVALAWRRSVMGGVVVVLIGIFLFTGTTGLPWPAMIAIAAAIGFWAGGWRIAGLWLGTLGMIVLSGLWAPAMFSVYICLSAIVFCIIVGGGIGVLAAQFGVISALIRPVLDLLQTIPPFVLLIPVVMFFQVGDFSAFLAIISYAIAPMIRYTERGLRDVPSEMIEAGISTGCTPLQLLFLVKLPTAQRQIMLGINQAIMYALAMLAVAALVGSRGLGQEVYVALGKADAGLGIMAGCAIAAIAICVDRTFVSALAGQQGTAST
ncbi:proline/glycine betaine ABC transporter permease [Thalassobius sp. Cn5-15]|uniref:ABC transporter permease n=1 Tax=Thalassobius sp. Cn5-15 TaxID=2917763 RepID=UPI001EF2C3BF|nr:ABC transporter permease subunit [Thalassobius sp. Cn5-15]MCG7493035.1 ABC transporter permease subunit [Thalassobius sp. Cn5-15]